jgi:N-acetylneuraminic acid mutarotase
MFLNQITLVGGVVVQILNGNFDELAAALKAEVTTIDEVKQKAIEKAAKAEAEKKRQAEEAAKAAEAENAPAAPAEEKKQ